jgi:hypothetical protein
VGSCHSFGVAVDLCGYGMCQMRGAIRSTIFLKMRRVGLYYFLSVPLFLIFSKSKLSRSRLLVTVENLCLTRPEKSLHILVKNPDSNLHFLVSPEIALHLITGRSGSGQC